MNVTVFGATGVVGRALVPLLGEHELTPVSRTARDEPGARWVVADAASGDGVAAALEGADVVYYLVHSLGARDFEEQDRVAAETVAREAANAGVRQIVYLGGLGADNPEASPHLRSRHETGERLASAGAERVDEVVDDVRTFQGRGDAVAARRIGDHAAGAGLVTHGARDRGQLVLGKQGHERPADDAGRAEDRDVHDRRLRSRSSK